eukprot:3403039-Pyramimonas_sp.AAC.1
MKPAARLRIELCNMRCQAHSGSQFSGEENSVGVRLQNSDELLSATIALLLATVTTPRTVSNIHPIQLCRVSGGLMPVGFALTGTPAVRKKSTVRSSVVQAEEQRRSTP